MSDFERQSQEIDKLVTAIVTAQLAMIPAKKDATNPFFHSKYADLPAVWDCLEPFRVGGIAITQSPMESPDGYIVLDTQLTHISGQWMRSRLKMRVAKDDPQGAGSALTYARRYALGCMTGLVTEEDDDGNAASHPQPTTKNFAQKFPEQAKAIQEKLNAPIDAAVPRGGQRFQEPGPANEPVKSGVHNDPASLLPGMNNGSFLLQFPKELKGHRIGDVTETQLTWLCKYYNEKLSAPANAQSAYRQEWEAIIKEVWAEQIRRDKAPNGVLTHTV